MNRYLQDRASGRRGNRSNRGRERMMDGRNPYGSRGGYVVNSRGRGRDRAEMDYGMDYDMNYGMDYARNYTSQGGNQNRSGNYGRDGHYPMEYEIYGYGGMMPRHQEYRGRREYGMDYGYDYGYDMRGSRDMGYDYEKEDKKWKEDLKKWSEKLKRKDKFNWSMEQVINQAKQMGVEFKKFDELEYYTVYLMVMSDYPEIAESPHMYLALAKDWLMDDDIEVDPSEKLCIYYYEIVKGGEEE